MEADKRGEETVYRGSEWEEQVKGKGKEGIGRKK